MAGNQAAAGRRSSGSRVADDAPSLEIGPDLYITFVEIAALKEQDVNAQVMQPKDFERLVENIRGRGQVESLPYTHQPGGDGPVEIISGHHRARAARAAGQTTIPVILDTRPMRRSEVVAKQIAHNQLHGNPDDAILRQLVEMIDNVDDLLTTGLPEDYLPVYGDDDTNLALPHVEFIWKMVTLTFLPRQMDEFKEALDVIDAHSEIVGVADVELFERFAKAVHQYGRLKNIRNLGAVVALLTDIAVREVEAAAQAEEDPQATPE